MQNKFYYEKKSKKEEAPSQSSSNPKKMKIRPNESDKEKKSYDNVPKSSKIEPHLHSLQKFSNYNWDSLDVNDLYLDFKELEKHLKAMIETDYKQTTNIVSDFVSLKEHFLNVWERILFKDVHFAAAKEIDKRLWVVLKRPLEALSKDKKKDEGARDKIIKVADTNIEIIKEFIQKMNTKLEIQSTPVTEDNDVRKLASNLLSYLGELFQIREKANSSRPDLGVSVNLYYRATSMYPFEGKYFMLISNCSKMKEDLFGAIYWGIRAYCCVNFYPMNEQNLKYLEDARLAYLEMLEREWLDVRNVELFKYFILGFLRYVNIIITKIGFEELYGVTNKMFEYLQKYITYLTNENAKIVKANEGTLLQQTILIVIYTLYHSIQGYNPKSDLKEKYLEAQAKTFASLASNDLAKECLKNSYGIIYHALELVIAIPDENYLNVFSPLLYYLIDHKYIADYLLTTYKQLKDKLVILNTKLNEIYAKTSKELNIDEETAAKLLAEHSFINDKLLYGFVPLHSHFTQNKIASRPPLPQDKQYIMKVKDMMNMLDAIGCKVLDKEQASAVQKSIFDLNGIMGIRSEIEMKQHFPAFGETVAPMENKEKNMIVLDGQNVAIRYGDIFFSSLGLKLAIDYWAEKGHHVIVFLPDYYFKKEDVAMKRQLAVNKGESLKHIPDDVDILLQLKEKGFAFGIPNWNYDDSYIIDYAKKKNAYIITNDRYNDHIENYSKNDPQKKKKLRDWIRNNCCSFTFIGNDFIPNPDFINEHMKS